MENEEESDTVSGSVLMAEALKQQGVEWVFGVVGIPVTGLAPALQDVGIGYIGMRNEQAVSCLHVCAYRRTHAWRPDRQTFSHAHLGFSRISLCTRFTQGFTHE